MCCDLRWQLPLLVEVFSPPNLAVTLKSMSQRMLLVKASIDVCGTEIEHLEKICEMFGIQHQTVDMTGATPFDQLVAGLGEFNFLYLGAHADPYSFGEADGSRSNDWETFGSTLCSSQCLAPEAILLLGCCRGGLKGVAMRLFMACPKIDYVTGPGWTVTPEDITTGFHVFLYNMVIRKEQPSTSSKRASSATGYDFYYYDRVEIEDLVFGRACEAIIGSSIPGMPFVAPTGFPSSP
jgi:hypothetical protein